MKTYVRLAALFVLVAGSVGATTVTVVSKVGVTIRSDQSGKSKAMFTAGFKEVLTVSTAAKGSFVSWFKITNSRGTNEWAQNGVPGRPIFTNTTVSNILLKFANARTSRSGPAINAPPVRIIATNTGLLSRTNIKLWYRVTNSVGAKVGYVDARYVK